MRTSEGHADEVDRSKYVKGGGGIDPDAPKLAQMKLVYDSTVPEDVRAVVEGWREPIKDGWSGAGSDRVPVHVSVKTLPNGQAVVLTLADPIRKATATIYLTTEDEPHRIFRTVEKAHHEVARRNPVTSGASVPLNPKTLHSQPVEVWSEAALLRRQT